MRFLFCASILLFTVSVFGQSKKDLEVQVKKLQTEIAELKKAKEVVLTNQNQKAGYALGVLFANNIKSQGADSLDLDAMTAAVKDVFSNKPLRMEQQQCMPVVQQYMQQAMEKRSVVVKEQNRIFLETNKTKEGVKVTASGLQYKVITAGAGKTPAAPTTSVTVHYTGKLIDGTIFDSSVQKGQPYTTRLNEVISGWTEALLAMKEGDKWMLYIPYQLGYGERGSGQIPPYATLVFEVELIKVN